jgi:hypothetical protein
LNNPQAGNLYQFTVAIEFIDFMFMAGQNADDRLTLGTQAGNGLAQASVYAPRGTYRCPQGARRQVTDQFFEIQAEAGGRPSAAKHGADPVITATTCQLCTIALNGKARAAVIGVAAKVGQIKAELHIATEMPHLCGQPAQAFDSLQRARYPL